MFKKLPYKRFTLLHQPSGRWLLDVPERAFDAITRRIEELRHTDAAMSDYRIARRLIISEAKSEGRISRQSHPDDDRLYTIPVMEAMQKLGVAA